MNETAHLMDYAYVGWQCRDGQALSDALREALSCYERRRGRRPAFAAVRERDGLGPAEVEVVEWGVVPAGCIYLALGERSRSVPAWQGKEVGR